jgi:hypothetical protein
LAVKREQEEEELKQQLAAGMHCTKSAGSCCCGQGRVQLVTHVWLCL